MRHHGSLCCASPSGPPPRHRQSYGLLGRRSDDDFGFSNYYYYENFKDKHLQLPQRHWPLAAYGLNRRQKHFEKTRREAELFLGHFRVPPALPSPGARPKARGGLSPLDAGRLLLPSAPAYAPLPGTSPQAATRASAKKRRLPRREKDLPLWTLSTLALQRSRLRAAAGHSAAGSAKRTRQDAKTSKTGFLTLTFCAALGFP